MPQRQELTFMNAGGATIRGTLDKPADANSERRAGVVIHRGIVTSDADNDLLESLAAALADAGMIALRFEPRTSGLILDDFHAFTLSNDRDDLLAAIRALESRDDVDASRVSLIGWSLGAMAACAVGRDHPGLERLCLINPATSEYVLARLQRSNGSPSPLQADHIPRAFVQELENSDSPGDAAAQDRPTLIVHAGADRMVPSTVSLQYLEALERANRPVERIVIARADHAYGNAVVRQACLERVVRTFSQPRVVKRSTAAVGAPA